MAIKEIPVSFRTYYKTMKDSISPKFEEAIEKYEKLLAEEKILYAEILNFADNYKSTYKFNLSDYEEFINNEYIDGKFYNHTKGLFINKKNNYKATGALYNLYKLARQQKELKELKHQIDIWQGMLDLNIHEYRAVLEQFYNEVHKKLIIDGLGYVFENPIGWVCVNRCKVERGNKTMLDFNETKKNKERLLAEGKRLWKAEEAEYAKKVGIPYDAVDYRVFKTDEYCYEFPLINCRVIQGEKLRLNPPHTRRYTIGKKDKDLLEECNYDKDKICELPVDMRLKLELCLKVDDLLYLNFIRNEGQKTFKAPKVNRKN